MFLHSNIQFLREFTHLTQAEFGKLFKQYGIEKTRSNIDSYERGNARPPQDLQLAISKHFNIPLEVLLQKDLKLNPGLMYASASVGDLKNHISDDLLKAKDEMIKELRSQLKIVQEQNASLVKQLFKK